jgi:hypothetical protein
VPTARLALMTGLNHRARFSNNITPPADLLPEC